MKKIFTILLLLVTIGFFTNCYSADGDKYNDGSWRITSSGVLMPESSSAEQQATVTKLSVTGSVSATKDTIISTSVAGGVIYTLPSADTSGMRRTFIDGKASTTNTFSVDPYSTNTIKYSISGIPLDAGDKITSTGQTGDSVTLISDASGNWYIESMKSVWTDGGA